ncbi:helix-turn-helix domain-containing protein [Schleiferilactobacillus perolens]|uniref:Uncharacterized protein n=1 Tax=Schleiferilactobacillus perolens DSM 12744 TaxID=1423792 RepID=A0A0R1N403_9LACO|nr:helix-turn-helix transcriptional regulator [Schleiferilactobacillus perolens]KRL10760.1 hypothetical protein FD09_GL000905 [Schleiferilactobacillus perolens DSM 12744]
MTYQSLKIADNHVVVEQFTKKRDGELAMKEINISDEVDQEIVRLGRKKSEVAAAIGITPQNLSNIFKRKSIPVRWLVAIANELGDQDFTYHVSDYLLHTQLDYQSQASPEPLNTLIDVEKEQADREAMEADAKRVMRKSPELWTPEEVNEMQWYYKELTEETGSELRHRSTIYSALEHVSGVVI